MKSPRQQIHQEFCWFHGRCRLGASPMQPASPACKRLDELLDLNDELLLHAKAQEVRDEAERVGVRRVDVPVADGMLRASDMADPYEKVHAHDPVTFPDDYHPGELRPDCSGCVEGIEHYHRKSDGSPVPPAHTTGVPRETPKGE